MEVYVWLFFDQLLKLVVNLQVTLLIYICLTAAERVRISRD